MSSDKGQPFVDPDPRHARDESVGRFHLRQGFYFQRTDDETVLIEHMGQRLRVPVNEWASAVAATSLRGDNAKSYAGALAYLNDECVCEETSARNCPEHVPMDDPA